MYEEEEKRRHEEALQNEAALLIQRRWRNYQQRLLDDLKSSRGLQRSTVVAVSGTEASTADLDDAPRTVEEIREALVEEYRQLLWERDGLLEQNLPYQRILAKHLNEQRQRKGEDNNSKLTTPESAQKYWAAMRQLIDERQRIEDKRRAAERHLEEQRTGYQDTVDDARGQEWNFQQYIKEVARNATFMRSSHTMSADSIDKFVDVEEQQRRLIHNARVKYIQLTNVVKKLRRSAKDRDKHNNGMFLIDFEQLKIENTNLNEKIEERNEDLVKLRRKVNTTIHVLTHVKEKLEFMKVENAQLRRQVADTEDELNIVRDRLTQIKRRRDGFAKANLRMREKMPLVGSEDLLVDYEERKGQINDTRRRVVDLTERHELLAKRIRSQQSTVEALQRAITNYPMTKAR